MEVESELEAAQEVYKEARNMGINLKRQNEEAEQKIDFLREKLDTENGDAQKRRQLLALLGPNCGENQEKVMI